MDDVAPRPRRAHVLVLSGVRRSDCVSAEEILVERVQESARMGLGAPAETPPAEPLPSRFAGLQAWPRSCSLLCWACSLGFGGRPVAIPTGVCEGGDGVAMNVRGVFCGFPCAAAHIEDTMPPEAARAANSLLCILYQAFTGRRVRYVVPGPRRYVLRPYGGPLTHEQFAALQREREAATERHLCPPGEVRPAASGRSVWEACGRRWAAEAPPPPPPAADCAPPAADCAPPAADCAPAPPAADCADSLDDLLGELLGD